VDQLHDTNCSSSSLTTTHGALSTSGLTEAAKGRKKGKYDDIVVFTPKHPAAVDEYQVTDKICERDKKICGRKSRSFCGISIDAR
jgi:hypothetical protein